MIDTKRIERIERFYEKSKEQFYIDRNKNIEEIKLLCEKIESLDKDLIDFEYGEITPEALLPSLFAEEFVEEDYIRDKENVMALFDKFDKLLDRLISEAEELMGIK